MSPPKSHVSDDAIAVLSSIDIAKVVSDLVATGAHLRLVVLTISTRSQSAWNIHRTNGHTMLKRLDPGATRRVIVDEEWWQSD